MEENEKKKTEKNKPLPSWKQEAGKLEFRTAARRPRRGRDGLLETKQAPRVRASCCVRL